MITVGESNIIRIPELDFSCLAVILHYKGRRYEAKNCPRFLRPGVNVEMDTPCLFGSDERNGEFKELELCDA